MLVQSKSVFNPLDGGVVNVKLAALDQPSVSSSYAKVLINLLASRGIAVSDLLVDAEPFALGSEELGSDDMITGNQLVSLIERGLLLTGDPNLGVWFGLQLKISTHGSVGYAALSSDTLGDAIDLCAKYLKTRFSLFQISACVEGDEAVIQVEVTAHLAPDVERFLLQSVFTSFGVMAQNLLGAIPDQVRTLCSYSQSEDPRLQELFDGRQPLFEQPVNQIRLPRQVLQLPLTMSDPVSRQLMEARCRKELAAIDSNDPLLQKVKQLIGGEAGRFPKLEDVAARCYMSGRTFKRRLAELGTSYQLLLDSERQRKAIEYLRYTRKTVDEIAVLLGYNDPSNFGRAFKRWTGSTPSQFRNQH